MSSRSRIPDVATRARRRDSLPRSPRASACRRFSRSRADHPRRGSASARPRRRFLSLHAPAAVIKLTDDVDLVTPAPSEVHAAPRRVYTAPRGGARVYGIIISRPGAPGHLFRRVIYRPDRGASRVLRIRVTARIGAILHLTRFPSCDFLSRRPTIGVSVRTIDYGRDGDRASLFVRARTAPKNIREVRENSSW